MIRRPALEVKVEATSIACRRAIKKQMEASAA
jgi:hypothetical protein